MCLQTNALRLVRGRQYGPIIDALKVHCGPPVLVKALERVFMQITLLADICYMPSPTPTHIANFGARAFELRQLLARVGAPATTWSHGHGVFHRKMNATFMCFSAQLKEKLNIQFSAEDLLQCIA